MTQSFIALLSKRCLVLGMSLMMQVAGELRTLAKDLNVAVLVRGGAI